MTPDSPTLIDRLRAAAKMGWYGNDLPDLFNEAADALTQARAELARRAEPVAWINADTLAALQKVKEGSALLSAAATTDETVPLYTAPPVSAGDGREAFEAWATSRGLYVSDRWMFREGWQAALAWRNR